MADLDTLCINTLRTLSIDTVQRANSGHPGLPLGAAPMAYVLWQRHLQHAPSDAQWPDRDRFVLSAGHGSTLLYSLLHAYGYPLSIDDLKNFRQWGSPTPGHPEAFLLPGVEATTGPLGQGSANAVGMAIAERALAHHFNRPGHTLVDHTTYALVSDGDLMEGVSAEAASLAGHLRLGKLIYLYDANDVSLDGPTNITFTEDVAKRYEAYGWHVQSVRHGDTDVAALDQAIQNARRATERPSLVIVRTTIGYGSPNKAGTSEAHGSPLGDKEVQLTKERLGWPADRTFHVPEEAQEHFRTAAARGERRRQAWQQLLASYRETFPELAEPWDRTWRGELPKDWDKALPTFPSGGKSATRTASGKVMNAIAARLPLFLGGDADLSCSTKTALEGAGAFDGQSGVGRNIHYGVREHAMGAIANGIAYHGGLRTYTATFFCFADYMRPAMRLAALNHLPVTFVFTHDSIGLGEDGPTHQAVEQLASLRAMPEIDVVRPCDANETVAAWRHALATTDRPVCLVLSRQDLPTLDRHELAAADLLARGAYILKDASVGVPRVILMATGSEVALALAARQELEQAGMPTRVVAMPCWELFERQDPAYRSQVLPPAIGARVAVEAGVRFGWERYVGLSGTTITVDRYGASAPAGVVFEKYGFTVANIVHAARSVCERSPESGNR